MNYKMLAIGSLLSVAHNNAKPLTTTRTPAYPICPVFAHRWAPRSFSSASINQKELNYLFEAARWAPSSYNNQPWRFLYARPDMFIWPTFVDLMVPANQVWASKAQVLVVVLSKKTFDHDGSFDRTHVFSTGAAVENMALQGACMGIVVHGMAGFDYDKARTQLNIPDEYEVVAMLAIGKIGNKENLPEHLQAWENPSDRKPIDEIAWSGLFTN